MGVPESRLPVPPEARRIAQAMSKAARRAYLLARGWQREGGTWHAPGWPESEDRGFYTLAAATYVAVTREQQREGDGGRPPAGV